MLISTSHHTASATEVVVSGRMLLGVSKDQAGVPSAYEQAGSYAATRQAAACMRPAWQPHPHSTREYGDMYGHAQASPPAATSPACGNCGWANRPRPTRGSAAVAGDSAAATLLCCFATSPIRAHGANYTPIKLVGSMLMGQDRRYPHGQPRLEGRP